MEHVRSQHDILVATSTFNERENLPSLVESVFEHLPQCDLLVIDDNSPDGTGEWCEEYARIDPRVHCLRRASRMGLGTATQTAMQHAIDNGYRLLVNLDADLSHDPADIPRLIQAVEAHPPMDVAIGSRYVAGGQVIGWPLSRRLSSWLVNSFSRVFLRLPVRDTSSAFRCYRVSRLRPVVALTRCEGYAFFEEVLRLLIERGSVVVELPIVFRERRAGSTKLGLPQIARAIFDLLRQASATSWAANRGDSSSRESMNVH